MSPSVIYRARYVLPISGAPIEDGALLVTDRRIVEVAPYTKLIATNPGADIIDFNDGILLPPFVNAHTHLELSSFANWAAAAGEADPPQDFVEWILWLVRVKRTVSEQQLRESLTKGLEDSLRAGTGAIGDICTTLRVSSAYMHSPLRGIAFAEILGQDDDLVSERLADIASLIEQKNSSIAWGLSPHSPYTLSQRTLDKVFDFAAGKGLRSCIHLAESKEEKAFLKDGSGSIAEKLYAAAQWPLDKASLPASSPVQALCRPGRLKAGDLVVHGVEVDQDDIALLKASGSSVVLCPRSNAALNGGRAPVASYLKAGVSLAIGTDSLASSTSLSIWEELAFASSWFAGDATPGQWLQVATRGGASVLGLQENFGCLSPGAEASFQVVSLPGEPSPGELEEALCTAGKNAKVTHLYLSAQNHLPQS